MTDEIDWLGGSEPAAPPAPKQPKSPRPAKPAKRGTVPLADAWLVFRVDGYAEDVRLVRGSHLNRLRAGEPRDWHFDIGLAALLPPGATAPDCWREFLRLWPVLPEQLAVTLETVSEIEGLEYLADQAALYRDATAPRDAA